MNNQLGPTSSAIWRLSIFALPLILPYAASRGDTIELRTGDRLDGTFKQSTSTGVVLEVAGQPSEIPLDKLKAIYFGGGPSPTAAGPMPWQEALDAVNGLRSVTESGISYRDYSPRVLYARMRVDRYVSSPEDAQPELRKALRVAMNQYELASHA